MNQSGRINLQLETGLISACGISDPGKKRAENEDAVFIDNQGRFLLLADGMGGQINGARASATVIDAMNRQLMPDIIERQLADITQSEGVPPEISGLCSVIVNAVSNANQGLYAENLRENETEHNFMGTTLAGLYLAKGYSIGFHIGDSRIYRLRNDALTQISQDHSLYQNWLDNGQIGKEPKKNILTRAIGFSDYVQTDIRFSRIAKNDIYLLCSDGLTNMLSERRIEAVLNQRPNISDSADVLVKEANDAGGADNISVVLCRINPEA